MATSEPAEMNPVPENDGGKKPRKRMKKLMSDIREQMEFYFGDSNLLKDRFLKKQMDQSSEGYVELSLFQNFNKMKALSTDVSVIAKALKKSDLLQVSEDGQLVRRTKPIGSSKDIDARTVYVEHLPPGIDHMWVKKVFSQCGKVSYVSLPKYRTTGDLKGFGFVEFDTREAAEKACEELNNPPSSAFSEKPGKFPKYNKQLKQLNKNAGDDEISEQVLDDQPPAAEKTKKARKRRRQTSECSSEGGDSEAAKKREKKARKKSSSSSSTETLTETKTSSVSPEREVCKKTQNEKLEKSDIEKKTECKKDSSLESKSETLKTDSSKTESNLKRKHIGDENFENGLKEKKRVRINEVVSAEPAESGEKKKKRKRVKKHKERHKEIPELRVISKKEWLGLRNEYLSLQKDNMRALKRSLQLYSQKKADEKKMNEDQLEHEQQSEVPKAKDRTIEFTPGVIVKVTGADAITRKTLKEQFSNPEDIAYIDVHDGEESGFIRCKTAEGAKKLLQIGTEVEGYELTLVTGESEEKYWQKLKADRESKLNTKHRKKKRGMQKIIEKAEKVAVEIAQKGKHIHFDD